MLEELKPHLRIGTYNHLKPVKREILLGTMILLVGFNKPLVLLVTSAAMNGGVMFVYSILLLYLNSKVLPRRIAIGPGRFLMIIWSAAFFGYFSIQALRLKVLPYLADLFGIV